MNWNAVVETLPRTAGWIITGLFVNLNAGFIATEMLDQGTLPELVALNIGMIGFVLMAVGVCTPLMAMLRQVTEPEKITQD